MNNLNKTDLLTQLLANSLEIGEASKMLNKLNSDLAELKAVLESYVRSNISSKELLNSIERMRMSDSLAGKYLQLVPAVARFFDHYNEELSLYNSSEEMRKDEPSLIGDKELYAYTLSALLVFPELPIVIPELK